MQHAPQVFHVHSGYGIWCLDVPGRVSLPANGTVEEVVTAYAKNASLYLENPDFQASVHVRMYMSNHTHTHTCRYTFVLYFMQGTCSLCGFINMSVFANMKYWAQRCEKVQAAVDDEDGGSQPTEQATFQVTFQVALLRNCSGCTFQHAHGSSGEYLGLQEQAAEWLCAAQDCRPQGQQDPERFLRTVRIRV